MSGLAFFVFPLEIGGACACNIKSTGASVGQGFSQAGHLEYHENIAPKP